MNGMSFAHVTIKRFWQTVNLLKDAAEENVFRTFVSGSRKGDVEKFVEQVRRGAADLRVQLVDGLIDPGAFKPDLDGFTLPDVPPKSLRWRNLHVGISRLDIAMQPPYSIIYTVDPYIFSPQDETDYFSVTFDGQDYADVSCAVLLGSVKVALYERDEYREETFCESKTVLAANSADLYRKKENSTNWTVRVTGVDLENYFFLTYNKRVRF